MSGYLSLVDGRTFPVRDGFVIGRGAGCDLVLEDGKASRKHVRLVVAGGVVEVEDLGSSNGTLLNGKPVTRRMLRGGDEVQIGTTVLTYRDGEAPAAKAPAGGIAKPAAVFDDEDDLFGGGAAASPAPVVAPAPAPAPTKPAPAPPPAPTPAPPPAPAAAEPPQAAPRPPKTAVIEFADEIVEVKKPAAAPAKAAPAASSGEPALASKQRILQYSANAGRGGLLGDDLDQVSGGKRALLVALVLAVAGVLAFVVMKLVR